MGCEEVKELLDEYICGELDKEQSRQVRAHLDTCRECRQEYEQLKALKAELGALSRPVPQGFDNRLAGRIRRERRFAFINRISIGAAAAVVLVCVIGIGYGGGYNTGLEDKMRSVGSPEITTQADMQETTVNPGENTVEETTEPPAVLQTEPPEEVTAQRESAEVVTAAADDREIALETLTEAVTENTAVSTQAAVNEENIPAETEMTTLPVYEDTPVGSAQVGRSLIIESQEEVSSDLQMPTLDSAPAVAAVQEDEGASLYQEADVNLSVRGADVEALADILAGAEKIADVQTYEDTLTARAEGISLEELKALLSDFNVAEESVYIEEGTLDYSIRIRVQ